MQVSPSGMAAASQAVPGEFDSRHLLQNKRMRLLGCILLFWDGNAVEMVRLSRATLIYALGHARSYLSSLAYLVPKKRYQRFS